MELFCSYSHKDAELRDHLEKHLSHLKHNGLISIWHDRLLDPGDNWKDQIDEHLERARIILLLVSADFLASTYPHDIEAKRAMERHSDGNARVVPVILQPCVWEYEPFASLAVLPSNSRPVTKWR